MNLHCYLHPTLASAELSSCELSLLKNNKNNILLNCDFRVLLNKRKSQITKLFPLKVLVHSTPLVTLNCPSGQRVVTSYTFCIIQVPCLCSLSTQTLTVPAHLGTCQLCTDEVTYLHPVNLALLGHFFESSFLDDFYGDTLYQQAVQVKFPKFHVYSHQFQAILANDHNDHLSLKRMVQSVKNNNIIFKTLTESLLDGQIKIKTNFLMLNSFF